MRTILAEKFFPWFVYLIFFLLPWQTHYIVGNVTIFGQFSEYGLLNIYIVELLVAFAFFAWGRLHILPIYKKVIRYLGLVLLFSGLSIFLATSFDVAFFAWVHLLFAGMLFCLLLDGRINSRLTGFAFVLGLIVPIVLGIWQTFIGTSPAVSLLGLAARDAASLGDAVVQTESERLLRAYGSFPHPNIFGGYLSVAIITTLWLWQLRGRFAHVLIPILSFGFILTLSRSAFLSFATSVLVMFCVVIWKKREVLNSFVKHLLITGLALFIPIIIFTPFVFSRFETNLPTEQISLSERAGQYAIYPGVVSTPWYHPLIGSGLGTYVFDLSQIEPGLMASSYQPIHNVPLLILSELGVFGLILVIIWASSVDRLNYAAIARGNYGAIFGIGLGTIVLVIAFFDHYLWSFWSGLALLAFVMAMTLRMSEDA